MITTTDSLYLDWISKHYINPAENCTMTTQNPDAVNTVFNTAYGDRNTLNDLVGYLKEYLSIYNPKIAEVAIEYGPNRAGDIPHSLASIEKAKTLLGYDPQFSLQEGLKEAVDWYWEHLR